MSAGGARETSVPPAPTDELTPRSQPIADGRPIRLCGAMEVAGARMVQLDDAMMLAQLVVRFAVLADLEAARPSFVGQTTDQGLIH